MSFNDYVCARDAFDARVPNLEPRYDELGATLTASPLSIDRQRVYVTEYFDPVRDEDGEFCDQKILEESARVDGVGHQRPRGRVGGHRDAPHSLRP